MTCRSAGLSILLGKLSLGSNPLARSEAGGSSFRQQQLFMISLPTRSRETTIFHCRVCSAGGNPAAGGELGSRLHVGHHADIIVCGW